MRYATIVILASLLLVACGGDDDDDRTAAETAPRVSKTQAAVMRARLRFIERGDAICRRANAAGAEINAGLQSARGGSPSKQLAAAAPFFRKAARVVDRAARGLRALKAPRRDRRVVGRYLAAVDDQRDVLHRMSDAAAQGNVSEFRSAAARLQAIAARSQALAQRYGFGECGGGAG